MDLLIVTQANVEASPRSVTSFQQVFQRLKDPLQNTHHYSEHQFRLNRCDKRCSADSLYHHRLFIVDGSSSINEAVELLSRERRSIPPIRLIGRHYINVCQQHVRLQIRLASWYCEQVAVVSHHLMLDQTG